MASHLKDDVLHGHDHSSAHASDSKWRHQESSSYARHAEKDSFLNTARVQQGGHDAGKVHPHGVDYGAAAQNGTGVVGEGAMQDGDSGMRTVVKCGPLLNYRRMDTEKKTWLGSVLVVTGGGENTEPLLRLRTTSSGNQNELGDGNLDGAGGSKHLNNESDGMNGLNGAEAQTNSTHMTNGAGNDNEITVQGVKLYADPVNTFWRFNLEVPMKDSDVRCEYTISSLKYAETKAEKQIFHVPALNESMRIMFHSCNGFSVGTVCLASLTRRNMLIHMPRTRKRSVVRVCGMTSVECMRRHLSTLCESLLILNSLLGLTDLQAWWRRPNLQRRHQSQRPSQDMDKNRESNQAKGVSLPGTIKEGVR